MSSCAGTVRMLMLRLSHLWILSFLFLQLCNAIPCKVTQDAGETIYSVPEFNAGIPADCQFYWTNASGYVLANHESKMNDIVASIVSLHTHGCLKQVHYKRDCISEGTPHEANCSINCSRNAALLSGGDRLTTRVPLSLETKPGHPTPVVPHIHWIVPVVVIVGVLLVVLVVLGYRHRRRICRNTRCSVV